MGRCKGEMLDDRDIDRLLAGRSVEGEEELAELLAHARATYVQEPRPELREHLLAAMASERPATHPPTPTRTRRSMLPTRIAVRLGAATGALLLATASLAVAGVNLPDPASDAFDRAGVSLPNQDDGEPADRGRSEEVQAIIDATPPSERDCAFGHRVAEAARGMPLPEEARGACERGEQGQARGEERSAEGRARAEENRGSSEAGEENGSGDSAGREFGRETSERAQEQRNATPEQRRQFGEETSERARQHAREQAQRDGNPGPPATPEPDADEPQGQGGPPAGTPRGKPEGTPGGPPEGVPGGRP
ncbi:MAG: hypothetical protein WD844_05060 [Thermoleophilaceae bacterium]